MRWIIAAAFVLLLAVSARAQSFQVTIPCSEPTAVMAYAMQNGFSPIGQGLNDNGDLVTLWRTEEGRFMVTLSLKQGPVCGIFIGSDWAEKKKGQES